MFSASLRTAQPLACRLFESALLNGKVANAYLLVGRSAENKAELAREIAAYVNCEKRETLNSSCLVAAADSAQWCRNCKWISDDKHPQAWMMISGEGKSQKIPVEKVRALTDELAKTSSFVRVIVVPDASEESFHRPAANALLKSIEEPPANCLFFFFADSTDDVLATIVSRCQVVPVNRGMQLGYWKKDAGVADAAVVEKLEAARAAFLMNARKHYGAPNTQPYLRGVSDSMELSRQLQDLCKQLIEANLDEYSAADRALDVFVASEIEVLKDAAYENAACARYMSRVCDLAEKCKRQISDYVKQSNAIDAFVLELNELRNAHSGELSCAKR